MMVILSARILPSGLELSVVDAGDAGDAGDDAGDGVDDDAGQVYAGITGPFESNYALVTIVTSLYWRFDSAERNNWFLVKHNY